MRVTVDSAEVMSVELTRRNLLALLEKLDDKASNRTIYKKSEDDAITVFVKAVEDDEHYGDRSPGAMFMPTSGRFI